MGPGDGPVIRPILQPLWLRSGTPAALSYSVVCLSPLPSQSCCCSQSSDRCRLCLGSSGHYNCKLVICFLLFLFFEFLALQVEATRLLALLVDFICWGDQQPSSLKTLARLCRFSVLSSFYRTQGCLMPHWLGGNVIIFLGL